MKPLPGVANRLPYQIQPARNPKPMPNSDTTLKQRLTEAGLHAMRLRASDLRRLVELRVLPVGVEVCVMGRRENKALIGWENIEVAKTNLIVEQIDEIIRHIDIPDTLHDHGNPRPRWR